MQKNIYLIVASIFFSACSIFEKETSIPEKIKYEVIQVKDLEDLKEKSGKSFVYSLDGLKLNNLSIPVKKNTFVTLLLPSINIVNEKIKRDREIVEILSKKEKITKEDQLIYNDIFEKYKVKNGDIKTLKERMIIYPTPLILAQGALESGWGTSEVFQKANNLFGMHSFSEKEPRIPSRAKNVYLKKYNSIEGSVYDFILTLSRGKDYKKLREAIKNGKSPQEVAKYLVDYSAIKEQYTVEINEVIKSNNFMKYN